jgi:hypothetical protein
VSGTGNSLDEEEKEEISRAGMIRLVHYNVLFVYLGKD